MAKKLRSKEQFVEAFYDMVSPEPNSGCWLWTGAVMSGGYGKVWWITGSLIGSHRASFLAFKGEIPQGKVVRHKCDNPTCVNPEHLLIGTYQDNSNDALERKRYRQQHQTHCKSGHSLIGAKLVKRGDGRLRRLCVLCARESGKRSYRRKKARGK